MERTVNLSPRLKAIADMVPRNAKLIDVGTDHGYLPAYLALNGRAEKLYASDLRKGPLSSAENTAGEYGVSDKIDFILTDGLNGCEKLDIDTVVIAGMGGELIADILSRAPWVYVRGCRLVLQPQSKICELSNWLDNNGYAINDAVLAKDAGRIYTVMSVSAGRTRAPFTCAEMYADRILMQKRDPLLPEYLDELIDRFSKKLDGMDRAKEEVRVDIYDHAKFALKGFIRMREETKKW